MEAITRNRTRPTKTGRAHGATAKIRDRLLELAAVAPNVGGFFEGERLDRVVSKLLQGGARPGDDEPLAKAIMLVGIFEDMEGAGFVFRREEP
jgi:hypothetical protein